MEKPKAGNLYLIPTVIAAETIQKVLSPQVIEAIGFLDYYLVENIRTARRFLSKLSRSIEYAHLPKSIEDIEFVQLSKDTNPAEIIEQLTPVLNGRSAGIISEAGCPGVADPGAVAVKFAHQQGIKVIPLVGPSSILLALMGSGFSGQSFAFHGYLPIESKERLNAIKSLEREAQRQNQTQIFMETPYRNQKLFQEILQYGNGDTLLCVAKDITGKDELIETKPIKAWRHQSINLHKIPTIFLISC